MNTPVYIIKRLFNFLICDITTAHDTVFDSNAILVTYNKRAFATLLNTHLKDESSALHITIITNFIKKDWIYTQANTTNK